MEFDLVLLLAAFGGGVLGAAVGALPAFVFTGFAVMAGVAAAMTGRPALLDAVAFGPVLGPHVAFGGGVGAAAYAAKRGLIDNGRDIGFSLMGLHRPDVLAAGGAFGVLGALLNGLWVALGMGPWTDTIALTVVVSAIVARVLFGSTGVFGKVADGSVQFRPTDEANWVRWQESPGQIAVIGAGVGLASGWGALTLGRGTGGDVIGFGIAAALLIFAVMGGKMPVIHHMALPAAAATLVSGSLLVGAVFGIVGGFLGELFARLFLIHGDTHIDPPAAAIAAAILAVRVGDPILSTLTLP